jgi:hypothetical protein
LACINISIFAKKQISIFAQDYLLTQTALSKMGPRATQPNFTLATASKLLHEVSRPAWDAPAGRNHLSVAKHLFT